ncbi:hypothetical protein [uncultured Arthrobacter sp.]|uniref:hypothetical protein n=1 Tax=uncultured Arthrobacter sp. TaxID=114050 RepID=UPI0025F6BAF6|nr:hypothetical protein [uncultured Arthrobacter sp.]
MTTKDTDIAPAVEDGGSLEIVRTPAWEVKHKLEQDPNEMAHLVCCRDLDWREAFCGYEEPEMTIAPQATVFCTMCVEVMTAKGGVPWDGKCPVDDQPCPEENAVDRMIDERTAR